QLTAADIQVTGTFPITVFNAAPGGGTSSAVDLTLNNPLPTITTLAPNNIPEASAAFALTINGSNFVSSSVVEWNGQSRSTSFVNGSQLTAQVSASDVATAGTASVTVINPGPGGGTSNATTFTIDVNGRILSVVNSSGAANSNLTVLITLASQGDENSVSFSLTFDPALLSNPQAVLGDDASGASLSTDTSEVAQGRYGVAVTLPVGQTFSSGLRQIVRFTFGTAAVASETTTPVGFTDPPLARRVLNAAATDLATVYNGGTVTITLGYEADVAPRPNGSNNGTVSIADWVQVGRFSSGLDTANAGSEFQRADCAPRATLGNDSISIADWVQAGRYASGLDFVFAAGGPTGAPSPPQTQAAMVTTDRAKGTESELAESTKVNLVSTVMPVGQNSSVSIEFDALGNENAFGFSLMFDPAKLSFVSAEKSSEASVATLNVNKLEATKGRVGIALALPAGRTFALGKHQLVVLTFAVPADGSEPGAIFFTDQPIGREVVDLNANRLAATFQDALGVNPLEDARFFVQQQYLDFLNRSGESGGLNYWTEQISECGSDLVCVGQRRIAVSAAFFMEPEFQQTGYAVYRLYQAAYGRGPTYAEFSNDRGRLQAGEQLAASTLEFANQFVEGAEFKAAYPKSLSATEFVNKLYETAGLSQYASEKQQAVLEMRTRSKTRAQVLLELIDNLAFKEREYNRAFVLMQYFGYLRREPDQPGYDFWLNVLNNKEPGNYRSMVCSFITSHEYQERFSSVVARSNQECVH
ncbi:MAG TPA: DUF4214 domain-containing protein, partial [Pyrinomonadaceae bacterium]|nr:DUF4214 domain-containing protein [Pyrinomonadaceae bacterium]